MFFFLLHIVWDALYARVCVITFRFFSLLCHNEKLTICLFFMVSHRSTATGNIIMERNTKFRCLYHENIILYMYVLIVNDLGSFKLHRFYDQSEASLLGSRFSLFFQLLRLNHENELCITIFLLVLLLNVNTNID